MLSEADIAYVAGLYEGEGNCWSGSNNGGKGNSGIYYECSIRMNDLYPLEEVLRITGLGKIYGPYTSGNRYQYKVYGYKDVETFLTLIFSRLSPRRKDQACLYLGDDFAYEMEH